MKEQGKGKAADYPIVETCTVQNGLKQRLMLFKLGYIEDYKVAKSMIRAYFESEKGTENTNEFGVWLVGKGKDKVKRFKNTNNEAELYPLLYRSALRQLGKTEIGKDYKRVVKGHLRQFFEEWENARKNEASESMQMPSKRKRGPQSVLTERAKKYFQRAIEVGYMEETATGYKWGHDMRGDKAKLGYFLKTVYNPKESSQIPYNALETLFRESRLDSTIGKIADWKNTPKWVEEMNSTLFYD